VKGIGNPSRLSSTIYSIAQTTLNYSNDCYFYQLKPPCFFFKIHQEVIFKPQDKRKAFNNGHLYVAKHDFSGSRPDRQHLGMDF